MYKEAQFLTKRNLFLFFSFFSAYAGYFLANRLLFVLGLTCLFIVLSSWFASRRMLGGLTVKRKHYPRTFEDEMLRVSLRIEKSHPVPAYMTEITDTFPAGDRYWVRTLVPERMDESSRIHLEYRSQCTHRRGVYVLGPVKIEGSDPLGIFRRTRELSEITNLLIYPQAADLEFFEVLGDGTLMQVGLETVMRSGHSEEFTGLREYHPGDNPKRVHWPSTARHDKLLVKKFREEVTTEVTLLMDMHRLSLSGIGDVTSVEYIIKAAAAVSRKAIEKSHLVQMVSIGEKTVHIPSGGGQGHLLTILDQLTYLRPRGEGIFEDGLKKWVPMLKAGSTAVIISGATNVHPDQISPVIRYLLGRNIRVIMILIDDASFIKVYKDQEITRKMAIPLDKLKDMLSREGCSLYIAGKGEDVAVKLQTPVIES